METVNSAPLADIQPLPEPKFVVSALVVVKRIQIQQIAILVNQDIIHQMVVLVNRVPWENIPLVHHRVDVFHVDLVLK